MDKSNLHPDIIEFIKATVPPEESEAVKAVTSKPEEKAEGDISQKQDPERFIGPRTPDHPKVSIKPGGRNPA